MTLKSLMSLSSSDILFWIYESTGSGGMMCFNADFLVGDPDIMELLRPFLRKKVLNISIDTVLNIPGFKPRNATAIKVEVKG